MMKIAIIDDTGREKPENMKSLVPATQNGKGPVIYSGKIDGSEVLYFSGLWTDGVADDDIPDYALILQLLKDQGCDAVLSASACSSLREEICPGECVIPNAFMDMTMKIPLEDKTEGGSDAENLERHKDLFSEELRDHMTEAAIIQGITVHNKGTVITVKNGKVLTRSESDRIRALKGDVLDYSTSGEAMAANEKGLPYARVMLCTSYDSPETNNDPGTDDGLQQKIDAGYRKMMQILSYTIKRVCQEELTD